MSEHWLRVLLVGVVVLAASVPVAASPPDTWTIDDDHDLTSDAKLETYKADGVASAELNQINARLTVADEHDDVNISGFRTDKTSTYVQLEYRESISRTVRVYLPGEMVLPYRETELESLDSDATASLRPVDGREYTAIKFDVTEPGTYTFRLNDVRGGISESREKSRDLVKNSTGWTVPTIGGAGQWEYLKSSELTGASTGEINLTRNQHTILQYQAGTNQTDEWLTVPKCDGNDHTVCYYTKAGVSDTVYVRSGVSDPPQVRYKTSGGGMMEQATAYIREAQHAVSQALDDINSLFGYES